jgi:hypothetical protein
LKRRAYIRRVWRCGCLTVFLAWLMFGSGSALFAQDPSIVDRLSPDTVFYLRWRGAAALVGAERKNHLLELLHDPAVAPVWAALATQIQRSTPQADPVEKVLLPDLVSLLDNSVVFGILPNPDWKPPAMPGKVVAPPFATYLVYDQTGKTELVQKWRALSTMSSKTPMKVTTYDFGGTSVEVRTKSTGGTSYIAQTKSYFLISDQRKVIEDLITRFCGAAAGSQSVTGLPDYRQLKNYVDPDAALELFGRIPDLSPWNLSESTKAIHLEKIHALGGSLSFGGEATRIRGAILGDTSPGGPFDLAGASSPTFQTLAVVERAPAFSISRIDFAAIYQLFMNAVVQNMPGQAARAALSEQAAESFLGMPVIDALHLFTGEIASMTTYADDGTLEKLFAVSIDKPDAVLRVVRRLASTSIVSEDSSGPATYLDLAYPYQDPHTHVQRKRFYYLAVTPHMLLAAPQKTMLRGAIERLGPQGDRPPAGVFANPDYAPLRSRLPDRLSGLGAADISQIPWDQILANFQKQAASSASQLNRQPPDGSWLKPGVISHYLHFTLSGWWKDSNGVYFDSYIE